MQKREADGFAFWSHLENGCQLATTKLWRDFSRHSHTHHASSSCCDNHFVVHINSGDLSTAVWVSQYVLLFFDGNFIFGSLR